jgi:uncharacterized alpha-E superfamily protein
MGRLRSELEFASVERILEEGLHEYLDALQIKMNGINDTLYGDFFLGRQQSQAVVAGRAG